MRLFGRQRSSQINFRAVLQTAIVLSLVFIADPTKGYCKQFLIYGAIPYNHYTDKGSTINKKIPLPFLGGFGIKKIFLIYENRILKGHGAKPDMSLLESVAKETKKSPDALVVLDVESWNRWDIKNSVKNYVSLLQEFKKTNKISPVGLYSVIPQTYYQKKTESRDSYISLDDKYRSVVYYVDFLSPSLYNYSGKDFDRWKSAVQFEMSEAKRLGNKPIIPFVTPEVWEANGTHFLSYEEMRERLETLKELGADGCIIWGGSRGIAAGGAFNPSSGWAKAVIEFSEGRG